ncbi:MAG: methylenetetrahydrofolate reductase [Clostridia bacterium]|nr:methylenetetrahydrofolate reductase [Clostridia bacterium]
MKISEIFNTGTLPVSLEIFPPKGELGVETLRSTLDELHDLAPAFISVTCSAGGSGNGGGAGGKTAQLAELVQREYNITSVAHLTCISAKRDDIDRTVEDLRSRGIENVLALRGDRVAGREPGDFAHASELIEALAGRGFCIGAACYPEGHITCDSLEADLDHLYEKQQAGASFFTSQLFFDNDSFYRFLDAARARGIDRPILPGIMPILSKAQITRMIFLCGASLPSQIVRLLYRYEDSPEDLRRAGIEYAAGQLCALRDHGVDGVHIYTMNHPDIARTCIEALRA